MENYFKQAQQAGIQLEKKAAQEEIRESSYDTSPSTGAYVNSKLKNGFDFDSAARGLLKLTETVIKKEADEDYVAGQLAAQTGKALEDDASPWTKRGYRSFQISADVNAFAGNVIGHMDEHADQSPEEFQQYLQSSFEEMKNAEQDPFLQEQMAKMFTGTSDALIKNHTKARSEIAYQKTINAARQNIVNALGSDGGVVGKTTLNEIRKTEATLPTAESFAVVADAAYNAMINGNVKLYEHLNKGDFFKKIDAPTKDKLDRLYLSMKEANAKAGRAASYEIECEDMIANGTLKHNHYLTEAEKNEAMNKHFYNMNAQYPATLEGTTAYLAQVVEDSMRNSLYSHAGAKTFHAFLTDPIRYMDGKPTVREESISAFVAAAQVKQKFGAKADQALASFLDEDTLDMLEIVDTESPRGILASDPQDLMTTIARVKDSLNRKEEINPRLASFKYTSEYNDGLKMLEGNIQSKFGQGLGGKIYTFFKTLDDSDSKLTDYAQFRGMTARNPELVKDLYNKTLQVEMGHAPNGEIAAKRAAVRAPRRLHNIMGNYIEYSPVTARQDTGERDDRGRPIYEDREISLPMLFGMDESFNDDDISENLGEAIIKALPEDKAEAVRKQYKNLEVSINPQKDNIRLKFVYDARTAGQKFWTPILEFAGMGGDYTETARELEISNFDVTLPIGAFRDYFVEKREVDRDAELEELLAKGNGKIF